MTCFNALTSPTLQAWAHPLPQAGKGFRVQYPGETSPLFHAMGEKLRIARRWEVRVFPRRAT